MEHLFQMFLDTLPIDHIEGLVQNYCNSFTFVKELQ